MKSAIEQILDEIDVRLALITMANGYYTDIGFKVRARITPYTGNDFPYVNYWPSQDILVNKEYGIENRRLAVVIEYHDRVDIETRAFTDVATNLFTDVWICLWRTVAEPMVTQDAVPGFGGKVSGVFVDEFQPAISEANNPTCAAIITLGITYKVAPNDPFTLVS